MSVHGFCDNKCKHEVYTKDDFAIIVRKVEIEASGSLQVNIEYPEGFAKDNCVLISLSIIIGGDTQEKGWNYYNTLKDATGDTDNAFRRDLNLTNAGIQLFIENHNVTSLDVDYKIVLMKIN